MIRTPLFLVVSRKIDSRDFRSKNCTCDQRPSNGVRALPLARRRCCVDRGLRRLKPRTFTAGVDQSGWDLARNAHSTRVWLGGYAAASYLGCHPGRQQHFWPRDGVEFEDRRDLCGDPGRYGDRRPTLTHGNCREGNHSRIPKLFALRHRIGCCQRHVDFRHAHNEVDVV